MGEVSADIRHQLALLARRPRSRKHEFNRRAPSRWQPTTIINQECGIPFSDAAAWDFIAKLIESGCPILEVTLESPPGSTAYVLIALVGAEEVYIKVQLGHGQILGRSFHRSDPR